MANTITTGRLTLLKTISFSRSGGRTHRAFAGTAKVYGFEPDDPKCKVTALATFTGIDIATVCSQGGHIGEAILRTMGMWSHAKNSGVGGHYATYPDPIGCPADRLFQRTPEQAIAFYRK